MKALINDKYIEIKEENPIFTKIKEIKENKQIIKQSTNKVSKK
jgi:hypothetical protein